ncbi:MAG: hypothetical protein ACE5PV_11665 [Candidatus Poribacteria bacterium]
MYTKNLFVSILICLLIILSAHLALALNITSIEAGSGKEYKVAEAPIDVDVKYYIDRDYVVIELPDEFKGMPFIMTANDDKHSQGPDFLCFEIDAPATVWVAHDSRGEEEKGGAPPDWLASNFKKHADLAIKVTDANMDTFVLWEKDFPAGKVCLGGNEDAPAAGHGSNYLVLVEETGAATSVELTGKLSTTWGKIKSE